MKGLDYVKGLDTENKMSKILSEILAEQEQAFFEKLNTANLDINLKDFEDKPNFNLRKTIGQYEIDAKRKELIVKGKLTPLYFITIHDLSKENTLQKSEEGYVYTHTGTQTFEEMITKYHAAVRYFKKLGLEEQKN